MTHKQADIIVWGENEFMNLDDAWLVDKFKSLAQELDAAIVADVVWDADEAKYDTAVIVDADGKELGRTPKIFTL